jgi:predicted nucleotidyltransferase component of viral defense system
MIGKQDILDRAAEWQLRPEVVEKDYVLGWLLAALAALPFAGEWVFKGGTCIKKCFAETYRFSEDLDFSLTHGAAYTQEAIRGNLAGLARTAAELCGLDLPPEEIAVRPRRNLQGQSTFEGRIAYQGPLRVPSHPRVRFDLTRHEPILDRPDARRIFHPYPDALSDGATVATYTFNEILAEKLRALYERARPRDLYDVVFLLRNQPEAFDLDHVRVLFSEKCRSKAIAVPSAADLVQMVSDAVEMRSEWANMLAHQLPALPALDQILAELPELLAWVDAPTASLPGAALSPAPIPVGAQPVSLPGIRYWGARSPLEVVRFAGANRLLVEFDYEGRHRRAEPYSLRRAATGNLLLYAWEPGATHVKAFNVAKLSNVRASGIGFSPRFRVEFAASGPLSVPSGIGSDAWTTAPVAASARRTSSRRRGGSEAPGPTYVFECGYCGKKFSRKKNQSRLRPHKSKEGWPCPGRTGHLVDVK